jgi:PKD repeat protein
MTDPLLMRKPAFILLLIATSLSGFSQNLERYNWYFGNSTQAIRFNRTTTVPNTVNKAIPFGTGGSSTASSPNNANLLFYTDGNNVYDATHIAMPNGNGLNANPASNQPTAICPVPGQANKYFIFTNSGAFPAGGTISVSVVDMGLFGNAPFPTPALGDVESKNAAVPGLINRAEGMIIIPDDNGIDFYLVTQETNSQNYAVTTIDAGSYTGAYVTISYNGLTLPTSIANFAFHAGTGKLAASAQDTNTDAVILNFDNATGGLTFDRLILNSGLPTATNQSIYDIEFSATGQYLYLSRHGEAGVTADLFQYDYANPTTTLTSVLPAPVFRSYGLQMGPDSMMYHLYQAVAAGPFLLGRLADTDSVASKVIYTPAILSTNSFEGTQFPNFAPRSQAVLAVDFTIAGTCENNPTSFFPTISPQADSVRWDFGDMTGSTAWSPVHLYGAPQSYNVTLTAFYQDQTQSVTKGVTINAFPLQLQLVQDTTACRSEFPPPRGTSSPVQFSVKVSVTGGTATSYTWSNGDTGETLTPDSAGYYYVVVTDGSGCSAYAGVNVKEYGLQDQRANIWHFGNKAGIDFNVSPPVPLSNSVMDAPEGCAIICDRNGKTLFYTDGDKVYDKTDTEIAAGIGGDPLASQSAIIIPVPGDETLYYIFTNEAVDGGSTNMVKYSLFDIKQNGGLGAVVQQDIPLFSRSTERITASGTWLIIHESGNNSFRTYPISSAGIGAPVITAIGSDHPTAPLENNEGYMKLGPNNLLAVTLSTPGVSNVVELFTLVDSSGVLTDYRKIDLNEPTGQVYGVEFSPGGNKVFATVMSPSPGPSQLFEYFIDSLGGPHFKQQISAAAELGAIQTGPDGNIYVAVNGTGSDFLGTITASDDTTQFSSFVLNGFALAAGTNSRLGLPNFIQQISNATGGPSIDISGICLGKPTAFIGTPTDAIDHFYWTLGDGATVLDSATFEHTYALANTYLVSMKLTNRCGLDTTLTQNLTIFNPPPPPTLLGAYALCTGPITLDANAGGVIPGPLFFLWNDGSTNQTLVVNEPSFGISVEITDANGCTSDMTTIIGDARPQLDLGPDQTICQNSFTSALNALNPGATYQWTVTGPNGGAMTTGQSRALLTINPGVDLYEVIVDNGFCQLTEDLQVTIIASPSLTLSGTNLTGCNMPIPDGTLTLTLNTTAPPTGPYSYFLTGPGGYNQQGIDQLAPSAVPFSSLDAGVYSAIIQDQISGCTISAAFGLSENAFTANAVANAPNCDPVALQVTTTAVVLPLQYRVLESTGTVVDTNTGIGTAVFNTNPITKGTYAGTYTIELTDNGGCTFLINDFAINPGAPLTIAFTNDICNTPPTITANVPGATTFAWTGPGIVGATNGATITVSGQGSFIYNVSVTGGVGTCPNTLDDPVVLDNPVADFTQSDPCQNTILLTASPSGNYTYQWYRNGAGTPDGLGQNLPLSLVDDGDNFAVEVSSRLSGCTSPLSAPQPAQIIGIVDAGLTATQACDDAQPFTLTAVTSATGTSFAWFREGISIPGETAITTTQTMEGTYKVEVTKLVCLASASMDVIRAPVPEGELPNRVVICNDPENTDPASSQVDLDPGVFTKYDWFKNELSLGYTSQVLTADSEGLYRVNLTNSFNCVASDEVDVVNDCQPIIVAPNAFRPTSSIDTNKNFFVISNFITDEFSIFIFNRWGELVFTSNDKDFKWNGGVNNALGSPAPGGSYSYVIRYVSSYRPEQGVKERRGGVALLR